MLDAERWCVVVGQKTRRTQLLRWVGGVLLPTALAARVALVAAYAWARGEQATDQDRRRKEKKNKVRIFPKALGNL